MLQVEEGGAWLMLHMSAKEVVVTEWNTPPRDLLPRWASHPASACLRLRLRLHLHLHLSISFVSGMIAGYLHQHRAAEIADTARKSPHATPDSASGRIRRHVSLFGHLEPMITLPRIVGLRV